MQTSSGASAYECTVSPVGECRLDRTTSAGASASSHSVPCTAAADNPHNTASGPANNHAASARSLAVSATSLAR